MVKQVVVAAPVVKPMVAAAPVIIQPTPQPALQPIITQVTQPTIQVQPPIPSVTVAPCSCGVSVYASAKHLHFKYSANHPTCISCGDGFETVKLHNAVSIIVIFHALNMLCISDLKSSMFLRPIQNAFVDHVN